MSPASIAVSEAAIIQNEHYKNNISLSEISVLPRGIFGKNPIIDQNTTFSQQMLAALLQNGFTKANLAKQLQISVSTLNRIARGAIIQPANKTFSKLLRLYCTVLAK